MRLLFRVIRYLHKIQMPQEMTYVITFVDSDKNIGIIIGVKCKCYNK